MVKLLKLKSDYNYDKKEKFLIVICMRVDEGYDN